MAQETSNDISWAIVFSFAFPLRCFPLVSSRLIILSSPAVLSFHSACIAIISPFEVAPIPTLRAGARSSSGGGCCRRLPVVHHSPFHPCHRCRGCKQGSSEHTNMCKHINNQQSTILWMRILCAHKWSVHSEGDI